jgi:hypothetical protein
MFEVTHTRKVSTETSQHLKLFEQWRLYGKGKAVPVPKHHAMKMWGSGGIAPHIL